VPVELPEPGTPVVSADAAELHDATSEGLLHEIQEKQRKTRLAPIGAILACLLVLAMLVPPWMYRLVPANSPRSHQRAGAGWPTNLA
jgi:hypothetical protein